jgi:hypothetical protein
MVFEIHSHSLTEWATAPIDEGKEANNKC